MISSDFVIQDGVLLEYTGRSARVTIPACVSAIGENAFLNSTVKRVRLPEKLGSIGRCAFLGSALQEIEFPKCLCLIDEYAFKKCTGLKRVTFADGPIVIGEDAFFGTGLESVVLPKGLKKIEGCTFATSALSSITLPDSLEIIGHGAFYDCKKLENIILPKNLTEIEGDVFAGCDRLLRVDIPDGVTKLGCRVFYECGNLQSVRLSAHLPQIEMGLFKDCRALHTVTLPVHTELIGKHAFQGCAALKRLELPDGLIIVEENAFSGCTGLAHLELPASVAVLPATACVDCTALETAAYPAGFLCIRCGAKLDENGLCPHCGLRRTEPTKGNAAVIAEDNDAEHWVYDRVEETPEGSGPCILVYDYTGPHSSVMLPERINGLPVMGVALYISSSNCLWDPAFKDPRICLLGFPPTARWIKGGDFWARIEPKDGHDPFIKRIDPDQCRWKLYGASCAKLCTALSYAIYEPYSATGMLFVNREGVWLNVDLRGYLVDGPDDVHYENPDSCRSSAISIEDLRNDVEKLPEHGELVYYIAYCYDYGMGTNVNELSLRRDGDQVFIESDFVIPDHTVDYATLCRGLNSAGLEELTRALENAGCPVPDELLEPPEE